MMPSCPGLYTPPAPGAFIKPLSAASGTAAIPVTVVESDIGHAEARDRDIQDADAAARRASMTKNVLTMQPFSSNVEFASPAGTVLRAVVDLAFRRLRMNQEVSPDEIEQTVRLIDTGQLDEAIERATPALQPAAPERYEDLQAFSHEAWKARHGVQD